MCSPHTHLPAVRVFGVCYALLQRQRWARAVIVVLLVLGVLSLIPRLVLNPGILSNSPFFNAPLLLIPAIAYTPVGPRTLVLAEHPRLFRRRARMMFKGV